MVDPVDFYHEQVVLAERGVRQGGERTWVADSAASALAWLRCHVYWPATVATRVPGESGVEVRMQQRFFFRGHADRFWRPTPHLLRFQGQEFERMSAAAKLAASIVDAQFDLLWSADGTQSWPPPAVGSGYAAVQHYGLPTRLLDWTANPSVAVHFATCSSASRVCSTAAVLFLGVAEASDLGLKITLPPAYISRLYRQRGLFTELTLDQVSEVERRCCRILLPAQPRYPALLSKDGVQTIEADLIPVEEWFDRLMAWSLDHAEDSSMTEANPVLASMAFTSRYGSHPAIQGYSDVAGLFAGAEHASPIMAYIFELAARHTRDGECFDPRILSVLERDNASFFQWLREHDCKLPPCY